MKALQLLIMVVIVIGLSFFGCATRGKLTDLQPIEGLETYWNGHATVQEFVDATDDMYRAREKARVLSGIRQAQDSEQRVKLYQLFDRIEQYEQDAASRKIRQCCWENDSGKDLIVEIFQPGGKKIQGLILKPGRYAPFQQKWGTYYARTYYYDSGPVNSYWIEIPREGKEYSDLAQSWFDVVFTQQKEKKR